MNANHPEDGGTDMQWEEMAKETHGKWPVVVACGGGSNRQTGSEKRDESISATLKGSLGYLVS